ncbi:RdgB/HAM1 family non-canonical purine NTP pyrophosphatase [Anaerotardibacter muris]|uniref:RdgB/HAM1 family non-canonical purine NTP pyrophosphatase n=1 Tax=Anaerotardibacter muris TaxID=2941505 RepID=UPI0020415D96|nr:RdgB/HAM1 family non-canonical purine NTP pyrophosphatase [Anaerotardibacter muris]
MKRVIIATNNAHKVTEIRDTFADMGWECLSLKEVGIQSDPEENGTTLVENARIKARAAHELSGCAVLADDSGLLVDALDGAPGVYSSRYAGEDASDGDNNELLLKNLAEVAPEDRKAHFSCVLVFIDEDGSETVAEGRVDGLIGFEERGNEGFGYDPLFLPDDFGNEKTFSELGLEEKQKVSHRARALSQLASQLQG